jgi:hypothetical protein
VKGIVITQSLREENQMIVVMILRGGKTMTAYEAMLKSKEDAAGVIACFCMAVLDSISDRELPDSLKIKIVILANAALDGEVEEVKIYETQKG